MFMRHLSGRISHSTDIQPVMCPNREEEEEDNREENDVMHGLADSESDVDTNSNSASLPMDSDLESDDKDTPL